MSGKKFLMIGDYVTFQSVKFNALLTTEGIYNENFIISDDLKGFDNCLFCIHLQRQYSAAKELNEFKKTYDVDVNKLEDESTLKYMEALERGQLNENNLNDVYMQEKLGQLLSFGDVIQLFHVKSRKYLQIVPEQLAESERENLLVGLSASGSALSWIQICPRYKIDREGDPIPTGKEIYLGIADRPGEYIHTSEKTPGAGYSREVNCSLESCSWRLTIFQSGSHGADKSILLASELIYIHDPETKCNLVVAKEAIDTIDGSGEKGPHEEYPELVLEPVSENATDSNALWIIESMTLTHGGPINWKSDQVRFKNLNTSLYMKQATQRLAVEGGEEAETQYQYYSVTDDPSEMSTLFNIVELNFMGFSVHNARPLQLGSGGVWMMRGEEVSEDLTFNITGTSDKSASVNLLLCRFIQETVEAAHGEVAIESKEPYDVYSGTAARKYLRKYLNMTTLPKSNSISTVWPSADRFDVAFFQQLLMRLVYFSQGFPISAHDVQLGVDKADTNLRIRRQNLLREQGILEVVLRLINKLIPITVKTEEISKLTARAAAKILDDEQAMLRMGHMIVSKCLELIFYSIQDHPDNQMYVADFMPVLLAHLGNAQPLASKCVTEMLSNNMELQETKIGTREIQIFVDKLRASKMGAMYLNLLQACCSCQGNGVDNNQCKVAELMFCDTNDIIINVHSDYSHPARMEWNVQGSLYIPSTSVEGSPLFGTELLESGLPSLALSWTTKSIDFSPLGLFGKLTVNVADLFQPNPVRLLVVKEMTDSPQKSAQAKLLSAKKQASIDQKAAVVKYFIAEMFLAAEMCMDRNYVAMHLLDPLFSFETLLTMLKLNVSTELKGAAMRLLMCLHVDRDPQASSKIPCLTRTWTDIQKNIEPVLPYVDVGRHNSFALIQQIVAEHVRGMANKRWESYSKHVLLMLRTMVNFNFYGTNEKLKDVIVPLLNALDRRAVEFIDTTSRTKRGPGGDSSLSTAAVGEVLDDMTVGEIVQPPKEPWERRVLTFMESLPVMCAVLFLVVVAVAVTIFQAVTGFPDEPGTALYIWGITVLIVFMIEVGTRMYCHTIVRKSWLTFMSSGFNQIDMLVISIDIIFLSIPTNTGSSSKFTKTLRLIRLLRLLRILRAARVVNKLSKLNVVVVEAWKPPFRFAKAPMFELETMLEAIHILQFAQNVVEDRNISLLLRHFYEWENGTDRRKPGEIFEAVIEESHELSLGTPDFDNIMIDVLMFIHPPLVQGALELLMGHHSMRRAILDNASKVQLLASPKRERQFKIVASMLQQLERNAETHELWGELKSDSDYALSKQTKDIISELTDMCRIRRFQLEFNEMYMADVEIQNLFRNLGCFEICMKVFGLLDSVEQDEDTGEYDEVSANTLHLCQLCSKLIYWFVLSNADNQDQVYEELDFFLDSLDDEIASHLIIQAIFKDNEMLMKLVPHRHLASLAEKICKNGKSHHYLSLFASITNVGEKNLPKNQFEIMKTLASPGILPKVSCFLVPVNSQEYEEKVELMVPFLGKKDITVDELPELLAYHITLLNVLSGCTVGRVNITTVEAKLQSVFNYVDIIDAIMDDRTIMLAKNCLSRFLFNAIIDVEMMIPGFEKSAHIWRLLSTFPSIITSIKPQLEHAGKHGWDCEEVNCQLVQYVITAIMITGVFFARYYDPTTFKLDDNVAGLVERTDFSLGDVNTLISALIYPIKEIYDMNCNRLQPAQKTCFFEAIEALNKSSNTILLLDITKLRHEDEATLEDLSGMGEDVEARVATKYQEFLAALKADEVIQLKADTENSAFISFLEQMPYIADPVVADVRYESLIKKLVGHSRERLSIVNNEKRLDGQCIGTTLWIIKAFRTMIENRMGMTIFERDENGGEEQDIKAAPVINALNSCGATTLCLDLIAIGIDEQLQNDTIKLGVAVLYKEGGAHDVQEIMNKYLNETDSELFFKQVRATIQKLISFHKWHDVVEVAPEDEVELHDDVIIVRFLQLMCEGHYLPNQNIIREQLHNHTSVNLLDDFVDYLNCLSRIPCRTSTKAALSVSATILEVLQGPCMGNQQHLALNTELIEIMNRILRAKVIRDCVEEEELELKRIMIDIFRGLLEGQGAKSVVYDRVLSVVHLDIIQVLAKPVDKSVLAVEAVTPRQEAVKVVNAVTSEIQIDMETQSMVLLQMFCDYKPSLHEELGISRNIEDILESGTACIETNWRGAVQRRFFHIPDICSDLAKSTKDTFVETVNRENQENKLIDFLSRAHGMYNEVKHQQLLKSWNLHRVFTPLNQDRATWAAFVLACTVNLIFLATYTIDPVSGLPVYANSFNSAVIALNAAQVVVASFTLLLFLVVKSPVIYKSFQEKGYNKFQLIVATATDSMTMYYAFYLILSILGLAGANYYLCLLLLDIVVKNSTTRDVLRSIVTPRKQLAMALMLGLIIIYIFAFFVFSFFQRDIAGICIPDCCLTLYDCTKVTLLALHNGGGVADFFASTNEWHLLVDFFYYCIVLVVLLNVIFGIIIDTFSELRANKVEKLKDTTEFCFICGIDKQTFDRAADGPDGFKTHITVEHNMWNYLFFVFYLWEQDKDDDDGLDQYIRRQVDSNQILWFPMNKAICLEQGASELEETKEDLRNSLKSAEVDISAQLKVFQHDITHSLDNLVDILKNVTKDDDLSVSIAGGVSLQSTHSTLHIFGVNILMGIASISGLAMLPEELENISCRIICESGMYSVSCVHNEDGVVHFDTENKSIIHQNVLSEADGRTCQIQILQGVAGSERIGRFLAVVEISVAELMTADLEKGLEKTFTRGGVAGEAIITVIATRTEATTFGKLPDGDNDEVSQEGEDD